MDEIIKQRSFEAKKIHVGYRDMQRGDISGKAFADDVVVITEYKKHRNMWNTPGKPNVNE